MTRYDNQLDSADPGLYATEPPEMGDDDSLVASLLAADAYEQERDEDFYYWQMAGRGAAEKGQEAA